MKLSHSSKNTFIDCSYRYYLHYMRKLRPEEEKSSFIFGTAIDLGLNTLLETKNITEAIGSFKREWDRVIGNIHNISFSKADLEEHLLSEAELKADVKTQSWMSLREKGYIIINEYNEQIMPLIKNVIKVQLEDSIKNEHGDELTIKTDFICEWNDGRTILFDNKTSSVKYEADSVATSEQLATYYEALKDKYKIDACGYIVIPKKTNKKKKPTIEIKVIIDTVKEETIEKTFQDFETVLTGVKEAKFEKNFDSCMSKYGKCPYYNYCHNKDTKGLIEK